MNILCLATLWVVCLCLVPSCFGAYTVITKLSSMCAAGYNNLDVAPNQGTKLTLISDCYNIQADDGFQAVPAPPWGSIDLRIHQQSYTVSGTGETLYASANGFASFYSNGGCTYWQNGPDYYSCDNVGSYPFRLRRSVCPLFQDFFNGDTNDCRSGHVLYRWVPANVLPAHLHIQWRDTRLYRYSSSSSYPMWEHSLLWFHQGSVVFQYHLYPTNPSNYISGGYSGIIGGYVGDNDPIFNNPSHPSPSIALSAISQGMTVEFWEADLATYSLSTDRASSKASDKFFVSNDPYAERLVYINFAGIHPPICGDFKCKFLGVVVSGSIGAPNRVDCSVPTSITSPGALKVDFSWNGGTSWTRVNNFLVVDAPSCGACTIASIGCDCVCQVGTNKFNDVCGGCDGDGTACPIANAGIDQDLCTESSTTVTGNQPVSPSVTASWAIKTVVSGSATLAGSGYSQTLNSVVYNSEIVLEYTLDHTLQGTNSKDEMTVRRGPNVNFGAGSDIHVCSSTGALNADTLSGPVGGQWQTSGIGSVTGNINDPHATFSLTQVGCATFTWVVTGTSVACEHSSSIFVCQDAQPNTPSAGPDRVRCDASDITVAGYGQAGVVQEPGTGCTLDWSWSTPPSTGSFSTPSHSYEAVVAGLTEGASAGALRLCNSRTGSVCSPICDAVEVRRDYLPTATISGSPIQHVCGVASLSVTSTLITGMRPTWSVVSSSGATDVVLNNYGAGSTSVDVTILPNSQWIDAVATVQLHVRSTDTRGDGVEGCSAYDEVSIVQDGHPPPVNVAYSSKVWCNTVIPAQRIVSGSVAVTTSGSPVWKYDSLPVYGFGTPNALSTTVTGIPAGTTSILNISMDGGACGFSEESVVTVSVDPVPSVASLTCGSTPCVGFPCAAQEMYCEVGEFSIVAATPSNGSGEWTITKCTDISGTPIAGCSLSQLSTSSNNSVNLPVEDALVEVVWKITSMFGECAPSSATCSIERHLRDLCGVCQGDNACLDCSGMPFGDKVYDLCSECGGNNQSCCDNKGTARLDGDGCDCTGTQLGEETGVWCYDYALCEPGYVANTLGQRTCFPCSKGWHASGYGNSICSECTEGTYADLPHMGDCVQCPELYKVGITGATNGSICLSCQQGSHKNMSGSGCILCDLGMYQEATGAEVCIQCPVGYYADQPGSIRCTACAEGTSNPNSQSTSVSACVDCVAGTYAIEGSSVCLDCIAGYTSSDAASECVPCSPGTIAPLDHHPYPCTPCPAGSYVAGSANTDCTSCTTQPGTYAFGESNTKCSKCAAGWQPITDASDCEICPIEWYAAEKGTPACLHCHLPERAWQFEAGRWNCTGCDGADPGENGPAIYDFCGVCGGLNDTCLPKDHLLFDYAAYILIDTVGWMSATANGAPQTTFTWTWNDGVGNTQGGNMSRVFAGPPHKVEGSLFAANPVGTVTKSLVVEIEAAVVLGSLPDTPFVLLKEGLRLDVPVNGTNVMCEWTFQSGATETTSAFNGMCGIYHSWNTSGTTAVGLRASNHVSEAFGSFQVVVYAQNPYVFSVLPSIGMKTSDGIVVTLRGERILQSDHAGCVFGEGGPVVPGTWVDVDGGALLCDVPPVVNDTMTYPGSTQDVFVGITLHIMYMTPVFGEVKFTYHYPFELDIYTFPNSGCHQEAMDQIAQRNRTALSKTWGSFVPPVDEYTRISVHVNGLIHRNPLDIRCRFQIGLWVKETNGTAFQGEWISCGVVPLPSTETMTQDLGVASSALLEPGVVLHAFVSVTTNGQMYSSSSSELLLTGIPTIERLFPAGIKRSGDPRSSYVFGQGFIQNEDMKCRVGDMTVNGVVATSKIVECVQVPNAFSPGDINLIVSNNGQQWSEVYYLSVFDVPVLLSIVSGPVQNTTLGFDGQLLVQPVIEVLDASAKRVVSEAYVVSAKFTPTPLRSSGMTMETLNGIAKFDKMSITPTRGQTYTLTFTAGSLRPPDPIVLVASSCEHGFSTNSVPTGPTKTQCACDLGYEYKEEEEIKCRPCTAGSFKDVIGNRYCETCHENKITPTSAARSSSDCECSNGYFFVNDLICQECPVGAVCPGGRTQPTGKRGFFPSPTAEQVFLQCPTPEACLGSSCATGYKGFLCSECVPTYYAINGECFECQKMAKVVFVVFCVLLFFMAGVFLSVNAGIWDNNRYGTFRIAVNFLQVEAFFLRFRFQWPSAVVKLFRWFNVTNLSFDLTAPDCVFDMPLSYYDKWIATLVSPLLFFGCVLIWEGAVYVRWYIGKKWGKPFSTKRLHEYVNSGYRCAIIVLSVGYMPLSKATLEYVDCVPVNNGESSYLSASPSITCFTKTYNQWLPVVVICSLLYVLGIPLLFFGVVKTHIKELKEVQTSQRYGYVYSRYNNSYFETVILMRKIGVVLAIVFAGRSGVLQLSLVFVVLLISYLGHILVKPYRFTKHNRLDEWTLIVSMVTLLCGNMFAGGLKNDAERITMSISILVLVAITSLFLLGSGIQEVVYMHRKFSLFLIRRKEKKVLDTMEAGLYGESDESE